MFIYSVPLLFPAQLMAKEKNKSRISFQYETWSSFTKTWAQPWMFCPRKTKRKTLKGIRRNQQYDQSNWNHAGTQNLARVYLITHLLFRCSKLTSGNQRQMKPGPELKDHTLKFHTWLYEFHTLWPMGHQLPV